MSNEHGADRTLACALVPNESKRARITCKQPSPRGTKRSGLECNSTAPPSQRMLEYIRLGVLAPEQLLHVKKTRLSKSASFGGFVGGRPPDSASSSSQGGVAPMSRMNFSDAVEGSRIGARESGVPSYSQPNQSSSKGRRDQPIILG